MDFKISNVTGKALPAAGGGLLSGFLGNKIAEMMKPKAGEAAKEPGLLDTLAPLVPGAIGVMMMNNKDDAWSYAGAGMVAVSVTDAAGNSETFAEYLGSSDNVLADEVDRLLAGK